MMNDKTILIPLEARLPAPVIFKHEDSPWETIPEWQRWPKAKKQKKVRRK